MPTALHETLVEMFRHRPTLAAELLGGALGLELPAFGQARVDGGEFTDLTPTEYRADAVVVLSTDETPVLAVVVEVQMRRDRDKRFTWPVYLTSLRARLRCPTMLLVVCVDDAVAAWCARPIELGHPGLRLAPVVLGPDRVPVVTEPQEARQSPEMAVLSAMAHGGDPARHDVLDVLLGAISTVDQQHASLYPDIVLAALPAAAHRYLEGLMATKLHEYQSEFVRKYIFQGRAEGRVEGIEEGVVQGEAKALLTVLDTRGILVTETARTRIADCRDPEQLDMWLRRAITVDSTDDLFA